jgi:hypothetical protein
LNAWLWPVGDCAHGLTNLVAINAHEVISARIKLLSEALLGERL